MRYLIDGYNLLFHLPIEPKTLEKGRIEIIDYLLDVNLSLTIIFDGKGENVAQRTHKGSLEIVYTAQGQSADAYILEELSWAKNPKNYTVITSDKRLSAVCAHMGAYYQSISEFLTILNKRESRKIQEKAREKPFKDSDRELQRLLKIFTELDKNSQKKLE